VQMLWINLIMHTFAALALASEPPDWSLMKNKPRRPDAFIVTPAMTKTILLVGGIFLALFLILLLGFSASFPLDASTLAGRHNLSLFFTGFVLLQFWNLFNARVFGTERSAFDRLGESKTFLLMAGIILLGQILLVQFGGSMFRVTPLSLGEWITLLIITSPVLWIGEFLRYDKRLRRRPGYWVYS
ncbi:MAG: cation transporting ATPase C-terminal domain-containing protein, partial [Planctomycetes bacterium]|nr:cation transporting ATPase C-terminal domain-containing protein [Planctomycetota bacterium]